MRKTHLIIVTCAVVFGAVVRSQAAGPVTQIFVKSAQGSTVHFAVFQWNPVILETEIVAHAGDTLAPSSYMLVDVRQDPSHGRYVLLVDPDGKEIRRDVLKDQTDPRFIQNEKDAAGGY